MPINGPDVHTLMLLTRDRLLATNSYTPSRGLSHSEIPSAPSRTYTDRLSSLSRSGSSNPQNSAAAAAEPTGWDDTNAGWSAPKGWGDAPAAGWDNPTGWDDPSAAAPTVYAAPYWLTLYDLAPEAPEWMTTADGSSAIDFESSLRGEPDILAKVAEIQAPKRSSCEFFWKRGFCGFGLDCEFRHDVGAGSPVCAEFKKTGRCVRGKGCKLMHYGENWMEVKGVAQRVKEARVREKRDQKEMERRERRRKQRKDGG